MLCLPVQRYIGITQKYPPILFHHGGAFTALWGNQRGITLFYTAHLLADGSQKALFLYERIHAHAPAAHKLAFTVCRIDLVRCCQGAGAQRAIGCKSLTAASGGGEGTLSRQTRLKACELLGENLTGRANSQCWLYAAVLWGRDQWMKSFGAPEVNRGEHLNERRGV